MGRAVSGRAVSARIGVGGCRGTAFAAAAHGVARPCRVGEGPCRGAPVRESATPPSRELGARARDRSRARSGLRRAARRPPPPHRVLAHRRVSWLVEGAHPLLTIALVGGGVAVELDDVAPYPAWRRALSCCLRTMSSRCPAVRVHPSGLTITYAPIVPAHAPSVVRLEMTTGRVNPAAMGTALLNTLATLQCSWFGTPRFGGEKRGGVQSTHLCARSPTGRRCRSPPTSSTAHCSARPPTACRAPAAA